MRRRFAPLLMLLVAGVAPAWAASSFTLDNITVEGAGTTYRAGRLDVTDSVLSRDEVLALLSGSAKGPAPDIIAKVGAARIATPELVTSQTSGGVTQSVTYRDVVFENVVAGRVGRASASGATFTIKGAETGDMSGQSGAISLSGVDLPVLSHMLVESRVLADEAIRTVIATGSVSDFDIDLPGGAHGHVARIELREAGARALAVPMASLVDLTPKPDAPPPSPERKRALSGLFADILTSQSLAALNLKDVTVRSSPATATTVTVSGFGLEGVGGGRIGRTTLDGLSIAGGQADGASVAHVALDGIDLTPLLAAAVTDDAPVRSPLRFERIALGGLALKLAGVGQPVSLSIGNAAINAKDWGDLYPQNLGLAVSNLAFDLPADDVRARPLLDLGYRRVDLTMAADASYDPAKTELSLKRVALSDPAMGSLDLTARFSNVGPDLLGGDREKARSALSAALFRHAALVVSDSGLLARMIDAQTRQPKGGVTTEVRARWAAGVRAFVMALLSDNADRGMVADAAERFIRNGGRLALEADAPNGLGVIDVMLAGGLQGMLGKGKLTVQR